PNVGHSRATPGGTSRPHPRHSTIVELSATLDRPRKRLRAGRQSVRAKDAARPQWPASSGSITFNANVAALAPSNILRAGRNTSDGAPASDKWRVATRRPTTVRSTAGATNGATYTGTPNLSAKLSTFPKPN